MKLNRHARCLILAALATTAGCAMFVPQGTLTSVPPPVSSEAQPIMAQVPALYQRFKPDRLAYVYLADPTWSYARNHNSGMILRREITGVFGEQATDGQCTISELVIGQESIGPDRYGPTYVRNIKGDDGYPKYFYARVPCAKLDENRAALKQSCPECVVGGDVSVNALGARR